MKKLIKTISLFFVASLFTFIACDNVGDDEPFYGGNGGNIVEETIFDATFEESLGGFTNYSALGIDTFAIDYGAAQVTGYIDGVNRENDLWLISPTINLANLDSAYVSFEYIFRYGASLNDISFYITEDVNSTPSDSTWTSLDFELVSGSDWKTWTKAEIDITNYVGKKVRMAFHYLSTETKAGTWEIKNFAIYEGSIPPLVIEDNPAFDVEEMSIADMRALYINDPVQITEDKKIVGVVISDKVGGNSTSLNNFVIASEDNTTGIMIRGAASAPYSLGDKVEILLKNQMLKPYMDALQLENVPLGNIRVIGEKVNVTPKKLTIGELLIDINAYESTLVTVNGTITSTNKGSTYGNANSHTTLRISDDYSSIASFVSKFSTFVDEKVPEGSHEITGIAGINNGNPQLNIRNLKDVK